MRWRVCEIQTIIIHFTYEFETVGLRLADRLSDQNFLIARALRDIFTGTALLKGIWENYFNYSGRKHLMIIYERHQNLPVIRIFYCLLNEHQIRRRLQGTEEHYHWKWILLPVFHKYVFAFDVGNKLLVLKYRLRYWAIFS